MFFSLVISSSHTNPLFLVSDGEKGLLIVLLRPLSLSLSGTHSKKKGSSVSCS